MHLSAYLSPKINDLKVSRPSPPISSHVIILIQHQCILMVVYYTSHSFLVPSLYFAICIFAGIVTESDNNPVVFIVSIGIVGSTLVVMCCLFLPLAICVCYSKSSKYKNKDHKAFTVFSNHETYEKKDKEDDDNN